MEAHGHHAKPSFVSHYLFSLDHKMIARQFLFVGLLMLMIGGILAMLVRWQLAWPETPVPGLGFISEPYIYPGPNGGGIIPPQTYNALFTMHATIMIFFVVMPIMVGTFGNFLIPLMIGAGDMAFPKLNMLSFWVRRAFGCDHAVEFLSSRADRPAGRLDRLCHAFREGLSIPVSNGGQHLWIIALDGQRRFVVDGRDSITLPTIVNMRAPGWAIFACR
jgi:cytochrome c oxidase subunit 1